MATAKWITTRTIWCEIAGYEVELQERRIYPADALPYGIDYQVAGRRCSADVRCNLAGFPCKWAYTNPTLDRTELT
jgi:hypothetical protein